MTLHEWEYEQKVNRLKETLKHMELARLMVNQELESLIRENTDLHPIEVESFPSQVSLINDFEVFQLTIPDILPMYDEKDQKYLKSLKDYYVPRIVNGIRNLNTKISFDKPFILIHQFFPDMKIRDFDNRSKRFIFNGLRQGKLIKDDSWKYIEYMEVGFLDREKARTEIIICEQKNKLKLQQFFMIHPSEIGD
jgi:hypothetical protein